MNKKSEDLSKVHPSYQAQMAKWQKCRDFFAGEQALREHDIGAWRAGLASVSVKDGKATRSSVESSAFVTKLQSCYILPLSNRMTFPEYALYLLRGHYYDIPGITKSGYLGQLFGYPAKVVLPAGATDAIENDIDLSETPLVEYVEDIADEILQVGRCGILVDKPAAKPGMSVADAQREGIHPFAAMYKAEDILDWRRDRIGARMVTTYVKLREARGDDYDYRELFLDADGYFQIEWTRTAKEGDYVGKLITPTMAGENRIKSIPFYPFSARGGGLEVEDPPMLSLVNMAHEHYQASVEYAAARFSAAIPTPGFYGFNEDETEDIVLGGAGALRATNPAAHAEYLQTGADGLQPLRDALKDTEDRAAKMGSRALTSEKAQAEAAATVRIRKSGESVTLADIARSISRIMTQLLTFACEWNNTAGAVEFQLPTEFEDWTLDSADFGTLYKAYSAGDFPETDWIRVLKKRRFIDADRTEGDIMAELENARQNADDSSAQKLAAAVAAAKKQGAEAQA